MFFDGSGIGPDESFGVVSLAAKAVVFALVRASLVTRAGVVLFLMFAVLPSFKPQ